MQSELVKHLSCTHCGVHIFEQGTNAYQREGSMGVFMPIFCSEACAKQHDPAVLDQNLIDSLFNWSATAKLIQDSQPQQPICQSS